MNVVRMSGRFDYPLLEVMLTWNCVFQIYFWV